MVCGGTNYEWQIVQVHVQFWNRMGRWNDREGGLACRKDIRQEIGSPQASAARSEEVMCSVLPRGRRRIGTNSVLARARVCANNRALLGMQAEISRSCERPSRD